MQLHTELNVALVYQSCVSFCQTRLKIADLRDANVISHKNDAAGKAICVR